MKKSYKPINPTSSKKKKPNLFIRFLRYFFPWKGDGAGEVIRKLAMLVIIAVFVGASTMIAQWAWTQWQTIRDTDHLVEIYNSPPTDEELANLPEGYLKQFAKLYAQNPEVKGFLDIPDTKINYAVAQHKDNDFYLKHNYDQKYHDNGWPFADWRNSFSKEGNSDNIILYAHNLRAGLMFNPLVGYKKLEFYKAHPVVSFDTVYEEGKWKIFSCFITDGGISFDYHNFINADDEAHSARYIREVTRRSIIKTNVDVKPTDDFLTLSTCSYDIDDGRFVVVARRVRPGESDSVDVGGASYNASPLYPRKWYAKFGGVMPTFSDPDPWGTNSGGSLHRDNSKANTPAVGQKPASSQAATPTPSSRAAASSAKPITPASSTAPPPPSTDPEPSTEETPPETTAPEQSANEQGATEPSEALPTDAEPEE